MSQSTDIAVIFRDWYMAELASHYASGCPDEVMDYLTDVTWSHVERMAAQPATSADDLLLKIFPMLLASHEARSGGHPMVPVFGNSSNGLATLLQSIVDDFWRVCPGIAEAMRAPDQDKPGRAAI